MVKVFIGIETIELFMSGSEAQYYCQNCGAQVKSSDTVCPKCGKNLNEVGKKIKSTHGEGWGLSQSLRAKNKDSRGKVIKELKIEGVTEIIYSRKPSNALQLVVKEGEIVHIHCKAADCKNEWKREDKVPLDQKFDITQNQQRIQEITCKKCGRRYEM